MVRVGWVVIVFPLLTPAICRGVVWRAGSKGKRARELALLPQCQNHSGEWFLYFGQQSGVGHDREGVNKPALRV